MRLREVPLDLRRTSQDRDAAAEPNASKRPPLVRANLLNGLPGEFDGFHKLSN